jgi:hypothetical protein
VAARAAAPAARSQTKARRSPASQADLNPTLSLQNETVGCLLIYAAVVFGCAFALYWFYDGGPLQ